MIVITLKRAPSSLRGDLTKWCQQIDTGVYVGKFSARIRDDLWNRITENIGNGEATMVFNANNELGYTLRTTCANKRIIDFDGIPLIMNTNVSTSSKIKHGFSTAYKRHEARKFAHKTHAVDFKKIVSLDIETTGLNYNSDKIISIGAQKGNGEQSETFYRLIKSDDIVVPKKIEAVTKLNRQTLDEQGVPLKQALKELTDFIGEAVIVGYNVQFDMSFLRDAYMSTGQRVPLNTVKDIMPIIKNKRPFLDNYRLESVLKEYDIVNSHPHNALSDAKATMILARKLIENRILVV